MNIGYLKRALKGFSQNGFRMQNSFAYEYLKEYLPEKYFPYTSSSLNFHSLMNVINDLVINSRREVIEFGSGISTIIISNFCKKNNIDIKLYSIDHSEEWIKILKSYNETAEVIFIHAPLSKNDFAKGNLKWYDQSVIDKALGSQMFDQVLVDGPLAYRKDIELARYPAAIYMAKRLRKSFTFFLDDTNRGGEQKVIKLWDKELGFKFKNINQTFSFFTTSESYNFINK